MRKRAMLVDATLYSHCTLCPRKCGANRLAGEKGFCGETAELRIARAALHYWEEPCLSGEAGSGTVFFTGCNLRCIFCQNHEISTGDSGVVISSERLCTIFFELQSQHAENINLVTPTHFLPHIVEALSRAKASGLHIPVVYNTSGYESVESLKMLDGLVDIYLPDFKYVSSIPAGEYSAAPDYFDVASAALDEMVRQVGTPVFDERGMMQRGIIVRHLLLPGLSEDSNAVIRYLYETYGDDVYLSIMRQYTPLAQVANIPALNRTITTQEYDAVVDAAIALGVENGFLQEEESIGESFIPPFDHTGVLKK